MKRSLSFLLVFLVVIGGVAAESSFVENLIPDSVAKSLTAMEIFFYDFLAFMLDIFAILLFIVWILCIVGIIWGVMYLVQLPKKLGANNFHDAIIKISYKLWDFMK